MSEQLPFSQGDRVAFSTPQYRGTGIVVGMAPGSGFRNYAVVVEHEQLEVLQPNLRFARFKTLVLDLYSPVDTLTSTLVPQVTLIL